MGLTCNIDARGKKVRLFNGIVAVVLGLLMVAFWAIPQEKVLPWILTAVMLIAGGFMIFEARAGWCVVRAMGFKTRI